MPMRLSTPSLGITRLRGHRCGEVLVPLSTPSLGITLRPVWVTGIRRKKSRLSTPSRGITLAETAKNILDAIKTFNSLSRDHRARFRDFSALRGFLPRQPFAKMIPKATI
jgi:hypothetical protein